MKYTFAFLKLLQRIKVFFPNVLKNIIIKAPMIKKQDSNTKLINFRRQQRTQQLQRIRNSMRFTNQYEFYKQITEEQYSYEYELTEEKLRIFIQQENVQGLYQAIVKGNFKAQNLLESYGIEIVDCLKKNLSSPIGVLSLGNLISKYQVCLQAVMKSNCFEQLLFCLDKLAPGCLGQDFYLWALCLLTDKPVAIRQKQVQLLVTILQQIFKQGIVSELKQNIFLIRLIKNLSEISKPLNQDLTTHFANCFWTTDNQTNKLNIYLTCSNLITKQMVHKSTKLLIHLLAVCLRGRQHLKYDQLKVNLDQVLLSPYFLLKSALLYYNQQWQCMESQCDFQINGKSMRLSLHTFLLTLQYHIFLKPCLQSQYYECLYQFCKHAPVELTLQKWFQLGTIDILIEALTLSSDRCYQVLKILQLIGHRISNQESERSRLFQMVKSSSNIVQRVGDALYLFRNEYIMEVGSRVLCLFAGS